MAKVYVTGWEHGRWGTTNGGGLYASGSGTLTVQGTTKRTGSYALRCNPSGAAVYANITVPSGKTVYSNSVYFQVKDWNATDCTVLTMFAASGNAISLYLAAATHKLYARIYDGASGETADLALALDTWYRIDFRFNVAGTTWYADFQVVQDGKVNPTVAAQSSFTGQAASTFTTIGFGNAPDADTLDFYYDDLVCDDSSGAHPVGEHAVYKTSPDSDGTHNAGTNTMEQEGGTDIGTGTAYDRLNSIPFGDTTTYVKQSTAGTLNYAEVNFADLTHNVILGAQAFFAYRSSGTSANQGGCIIIDEDATQTTLWGTPTSRADYSESSVFYKTVTLPTPAGGWDLAAVNALKARLGYSNDVSPVPYWVDLVIEVAARTNVSGEASKTLGVLTLSSNGTVAASGPVGSLNKTLGAVVLSSAGVVKPLAIGNLSKTLGVLVSTAIGRITVKANLAKTLGEFEIENGIGRVTVKGNLSKIFGVLTSVISGRVKASAGLIKTLGTLALSSNSSVRVKANLAKTLGAVGLVSYGSSVTPPVTAALSKTLGVLILSASGKVKANAGLIKTLGTLVLSSSSSIQVKSNLVKTLGVLGVSSSARSQVKAVFTRTLGSLNSSSSGKVYIRGNLVRTLGQVVLQGGSYSGITAALNKTLNTLMLTSSGSVEVKITAALNKTLNILVLASAANVRVTGNVLNTLGNVNAACTGLVIVKITAQNQLQPVALSASGEVTIPAPAEAMLSVTLGILMMLSVGSVRSSAFGMLKPIRSIAPRVLASDYVRVRSSPGLSAVSGPEKVIKSSGIENTKFGE